MTEANSERPNVPRWETFSLDVECSMKVLQNAQRGGKSELTLDDFIRDYFRMWKNAEATSDEPLTPEYEYVD